MTTAADNELMTRVEGDAPLGRLMRDNYWIPFALSENLVAGEAPSPVRLFGENYAAFRAGSGEIGFFDELCPHRRASLLLGRIEGDAIRCIYHGWKLDVSGRVVEAPTQVQRAEQFCRNVKVTHFPVRESGGIAWVWLGGPEAPVFPDVPFDAGHGMNAAVTLSLLPCNWLQGLEGSIDSVHGTILHQTWIMAGAERQRASTDVERVEMAMSSTPLYEAESTPYGMRAVSLRPAGPERTYARVAHYFFPLVTVVPTGYPGATQVFAFAPVDDTHHLLFFGNYGEEPQRTQKDFGALREDIEPDPRNFFAIPGGRERRWGQDRELMRAGHFSGVGHSVIAEDAVVQTSMGPRVDRSKENLSGSDVAVAHARRLILDALAAADDGRLPPGSARAVEPVRIPHPYDTFLEAGASWRDVEPVG